MHSEAIQITEISTHVTQFTVPTPTLPPAFETNTFVIQNGSEGILVDVGTQDDTLLQDLVQKIRDRGIQKVTAILATHYHRDHVQGLPYMQAVFAAPIFVHEVDLLMTQLTMGPISGDLLPIPSLLTLGTLPLVIQHAPGHTHGHVHILIPEDKVILVGDHLSGDGSVWIGPPDGHMIDYYQALQQIQASDCDIAGPGHGAPIHDAAKAALAIKERRLAREQQILAILNMRPTSKQGLLEQIYGDTIPAGAVWVAIKTIQAHLAHLIDNGLIRRQYVNDEVGFLYTL